MGKLRPRNLQLFISCVSAEFGSYRDALRCDQRPNVVVHVQEDFVATGTETLDKLDYYIRAPRKIAVWTELCESHSRWHDSGGADGSGRIFRYGETVVAKGDPLEAIDRLVPWESFRADIETVVLTPDEMKKSSAGRKPVDAIVMFRMLVLQALHNLSDEQAEYQVRDRLSFSRFLRLGLEDGIPDATTLWLFREKLAKASRLL